MAILDSQPPLIVTGALAAAGFIVYCAFMIIYRLHFHPLAGFPGPKAAAASKWYEAYFDLCHGYGGQYSREIKRMHSTYGPIVRINPDEISINDPNFHQTLYAPQPEVRDKFPPIAAILGTNSGTFGTVDHYLHRKRRAANSLFFSQRNVSCAEPLIRTHVDYLCQLLRSERGKTMELRVGFLALKLDIFYDYAFSDSLGLQKDPKLADHWDQTITAIATCAPFIKMFAWLLPYAMKLHPSLIRAVSPPLARVLGLKQVRHHISHQADT